MRPTTAADRAAQSHAPRSQENAQCEQPPQSFRGRIRDRGRRYLNQFKPQRAPGLLLPYTKSMSMDSWMADAFKEKMAGLLGDVSSRESDDASRLIQSTPTPTQSSDDNYQATNVVHGLAGLHQSFGEKRPSRTWNLEPQSTESSTPSRDADADNGTRKVQSTRQSYSDRFKGYTMSLRKRVTSAPVQAPALGDLAGVGSQYDAANRSASALFSDADDSTVQGTTSVAQDHRQHLVNPLYSHPVSSSISTKRTSTGSIQRDDSDFFSSDDRSDQDLLNRRFSSETAAASVSVASSIFSYMRPPSTISTATSSWDPVLARTGSHHARSASLLRKYPYMSSSSSLNSGRDSSRPPQEHDLDDYPLPIIPVQRSDTSTPPGSVSSWVACLQTSVSDQVTAAGWVAQQRRSKRHRMSEQFLEEASDVESEPALIHIGPDSSAEKNIETASNAALSTIDEGCSDAGCSNHEGASMRRPSSGDNGDKRYLNIPRPLTRDTMSSPGTESFTNLPSVISEDLLDEASTPATFVTEPESDASDTDESMSDISDGTDESLSEAFSDTPLDPALLFAAVAMKDHIASIVLARVFEWMRSCSNGQASGDNSPDSEGSPDTSFGSTSGSNGSSSGGGGKKRGFDGGAYRSDRGNGDDQDKRRKTEAASTKASPTKLPLVSLACPFMKRYPDRTWAKCCQKPWSSVHRIKEHIYRNHELPIHCDRCFHNFKVEEELAHHLRQDERCALAPRPTEMIGINAAVRKKLKSRKGIQNATEEKKWEHVFKILFPDATTIPDPPFLWTLLGYLALYDWHSVHSRAFSSDANKLDFDLHTLENGMSHEIRAQYHDLFRREMPDRINRQVTREVNNRAEFQRLLPGIRRELSEVIHTAIWDTFDHVLPAYPAAQRAATEAPDENDQPETPVRTQHQPSPADSYPPPPPTNVAMSQVLSQETNHATQVQDLIPNWSTQEGTLTQNSQLYNPAEQPYQPMASESFDLNNPAWFSATQPNGDGTHSEFNSFDDYLYDLS
ncbi:hypothetical protein FALBO_15812 [Fusarium albosuccineum]|uniref:C2H2-type domain-containing protein n=1 Tax=Fusarium albosuccineum TaxID=1237068 RepID=A0A8H4KRX8_9HYPO|nr:hypothetical protein FALBO_15812 [Fusarium albosuccineum]